MVNARTFAEAVRVGVDALRAHPLRTTLSTLGIVIAVGSLVATLALFDGAMAYAIAEIGRETGIQTVAIRPVTFTWTRYGERIPVRNYPVFTAEDLASLRRLVSGAPKRTMTMSGTTSVERGPQNWNVPVTLATADFGDFNELEMFAGRFFTAGEALHNAPVIVLNHHLAARVTDGRDPASLIDGQVRVNGRQRRVVGILMPALDEEDDAAFVPLKGTNVLLNADQASLAPSIMLKAAHVDSVEDVKAGAEEWLSQRVGRWEGRAEVRIGLDRLRRMQREFLLVKLFIIAIAGIVLVVGGVGIMNVMLTSVTERTREIGIRKAVGARSSDVLVQFLVESVAIGVAGSVVGIACGMALAQVLGVVFRYLVEASLYPTLTLSTVLVAVGSSALTGLLFGTYPAKRAARLTPVQAIARE
jgi:putative ABC transport system permease protein